MHQDRYGLPISTVSEVAAVEYRDGLDRILSAWVGAGEALDRALLEDPEFALAYIAGRVCIGFMAKLLRCALRLRKHAVSWHLYCCLPSKWAPAQSTADYQSPARSPAVNQ
jgi:hypothetical protein